jgi:class 3 adenylate cyclase
MNKKVSKSNLQQVTQADFERLWRLRRYLAPALVKRILAAEENEPFGFVAKRKRVTFMFLDIRNFTELSDELEPETISDVLNEYYTIVADIIGSHHGSINKFLGDGLLIIFGDPEQNKEHKLSALRAAVELKRAVADYSKQVSFLPMPFRIGIGINSGKAVLGAFGPENHIDYTAIGSAVNIAARLQALADNNQIVACKSTYEGLDASINLANERTVRVKGYSEEITIADILGYK